jgi:hypothetical protein
VGCVGINDVVRLFAGGALTGERRADVGVAAAAVRSEVTVLEKGAAIGPAESTRSGAQHF